MPALAADWCAVTTVEGIGSVRDGLHPIQERMTAMHGSQCGFCTPGIVMALYSLFRADPSLPVEQMREHMDGNLCRCTGYRPILDAASSLCPDTCAEGGCGGNGGCGGADGCSSSGGGCCGGGAGSAGGATDKGCCPSGEPTGRLEDGDVITTTSDKCAHFSTPYAATPAASKEPEFPGELSKPAAPLRLCPNEVGRSDGKSDGGATASTGGGSAESPSEAPTWWKPTALDDLLALKEAYPHARLVAGNSEVGIESRFKNLGHATFLFAAAVPELKGCTSGEEAMEFGACAPLSEIEHFATQVGTERPGHGGEAARAIASMLRWFASTQIRNVACLGGNIATASPISDMIPMLTALGATMTIASKSGGTRQQPLSSFFLGYRKVALQPSEVIVSIRVPHTRPLEFATPFKQARRREDDISIVTAGMRVRLAAEGGSWVVSEACFAWGGLAPTVVLSPKTCDLLVGKPWDAQHIETACACLADELRVAPSAPGGQPEYRTALAASALFKFFVSTSVSLSSEGGGGGSGAPPPPVVAAAERSAGRSWVVDPKPSTSGEQRYPHASYPGLERDVKGLAAVDLQPPVASEAEKAGGVRVVGESLPHKAGAMHTTGEAEYVDDAPVPTGTLHGWLVRAEKAPATLTSVDTTAAAAAPGVVRVLLASDLHAAGGINSIGPIMKDELCFAESSVEHVGQVIGIVIADSAEEARVAAAKVHVGYGPPSAGVTPCYTIADAIEHKSFFDKAPFGTDHDLEHGQSVEAALAEPGLVTVTGEFKLGGQEHFYLEANTTLAMPTDEGGLSILASTQAVDKTQKMASRVTGVPCHKIVAKTKRMGGGFGGKETRSVFVTCAAAVAAHVLRKPVRLSLRRDVDMGTSGGRHPFIAQYTAAARPGANGGPPTLAALDVQLYSNGGAMLDLSGPVMDRALLHVDNCYKWPAFRARGVVCKTHTPPNTAFRGFGGPQGMLITEHIMEHLAAATGAPAAALREHNMYKPRDEVPYGQIVEEDEWRVPRAWRELRADATYDARKAEVDAFNAANRWRKRGLALIPTKFGINFTAKFMNQGGALVHLYTDGSILISHGGTEMGQGLHTKVCQVAARAFGVPLSACHVAETASDKVANTMPTAASASTDLYAMATLDACRQILARLQPIMAKKPKAPLAEIALAANFERIDLSAHGFFAIDTKRCGFDWNIRPTSKPDGTPDQTARGYPFNYWTQGVGCVEVEIDVLTGDHDVRRCDILCDLGSSINPALDIGQIEGAFTQGMGWTTTEELMWGDSDHQWIRPSGRLHTSGPGTYKIPSFNDVPKEFNVRLMSGVDNKVAIHSSKAVGEPPFFFGATVFFAIREAIAAARKEHTPSSAPWFNLLSPATSERIRMACGDKLAVVAGAPADGEPVPCRGSF